MGDFVGDTSFFECLREASAPPPMAASEAEADGGATASSPSFFAPGDLADGPCIVSRALDEADGKMTTIETTGGLNRLLVWDAGLLRAVLLEDVDLHVRMVQVLAVNIASKLEASQDSALQEASQGDAALQGGSSTMRVGGGVGAKAGTTAVALVERTGGLAGFNA